MTDLEILNSVKKIDKQMSGMTVNERLCASGLIDEFDEAVNSNKVKAKKILELLKVDKASIDKIVS